MKLNKVNLRKLIPCCLVGLVALVLVVVLLLKNYGVINKLPLENTNEEFENNDNCPQVPTCNTGASNAQASEQLGNNLTFAEVKGNQQPTELPNDCFPKDQLSPCELLPKDSASKWADVNPNGDSSLCEQNFLVSDHHVGVNTVGQALRNANRQIRSEPPNPQVKVSPWLNTTIGPDLVRRPLEIGENCVNYEQKQE